MSEKERCTKSIFRTGTYRASRCQRKAVKDGYCTQHHPDNVAARDAKRDAKWDHEHAVKQWRYDMNEWRRDVVDVARQLAVFPADMSMVLRLQDVIAAEPQRPTFEEEES